MTAYLRYILVFLLVAHAVAHLPGFLLAWRWMESAEFPFRSTILGGRLDLGAGIKVYGVVWLLLSLAFLICAYGAMLRSSWWLSGLLLAIPLSVLLCLASWPFTRFGLLASVLILVFVCLIFRFPATRLPVADAALEKLWAESPRGLRLAMQGEIKLNAWRPFVAEQVFSADGQMIWAAATSIAGLPVRGADRLLGPSGSLMGQMDWRLLDFIPVMRANGPDITRSAIGRRDGELKLWFPEALPSTAVATGPFHLESDGSGLPRSIRFPRWGNPDQQGWRLVDFGVSFEEYREFAGHRIPSRIRAGWFFGRSRYTEEGEFFRATITAAEYR